MAETSRAVRRDRSKIDCHACVFFDSRGQENEILLPFMTKAPVTSRVVV